LADVRDTITATGIIERADFSESGLLTPDQRRAVADLDDIIVANCGVGLSAQFGVLGPHIERFEFDDPDAQPGVTTTTAVPDTSTTSTSLPARLPNAAVAVVGDSLTLGAQLEITSTLSGLGLGVVAIDGQVSRRMTSSTDTIRSGLAVVEEVAATSSPRIWVIALGTNDVASGSSPGQIRGSVERVLAAIPPDALVVWVDTWIRDERDAVVAGNLIIRDAVASRPGAVVADFFSYADDAGIVGSDGVHLTAAGNALFANVMANGIADVLGRNPLFDLSSPTDAPTTTRPAVAPLVTDPGAPPPVPTIASGTTTTTTSTVVATTTTSGTTSTSTTSSTTVG
jgi:lysophospholipase L1-like esterase